MSKVRIVFKPRFVNSYYEVQVKKLTWRVAEIFYINSYQLPEESYDTAKKFADSLEKTLTTKGGKL